MITAKALYLAFCLLHGALRTLLGARVGRLLHLRIQLREARLQLRRLVTQELLFLARALQLRARGVWFNRRPIGLTVRGLISQELVLLARTLQLRAAVETTRFGGAKSRAGATCGEELLLLCTPTSCVGTRMVQ